MNDLRNSEDYLMAKAIILKSLKSRSGKLLTEYGAWDRLDYDVRKQALFDMTCFLCRRVRELTGSYHHVFGVEAVCKDCDDNWVEVMKRNGIAPVKYVEEGV